MEKLKLRTYDLERMKSEGKDELYLMYTALGYLIGALKEDKLGVKQALEVINLCDEARNEYKKAINIIDETDESTLRRNKVLIKRHVEKANEIVGYLSPFYNDTGEYHGKSYN